MINIDINQTKNLIKGAMDEKNTISFTKTDNSSYVSSQERFVIAVNDNSFTHTSATGSSRSTIETPFDQVHTISVSYEQRSQLKSGAKFDYLKLELMLKKKKELVTN